MKKFLLLIAFLTCAAFARAGDTVFIVNPSVAEASISADDAKNILLGNKTRWDSGNIKLVVLTDGAVNEDVIRTYTQRTPEQFDKYWKKLVFTGKGTLPEQAKTEADVVAYVAATPGAVGYVSSASVTDKVKKLEVK